MQGTQDEALEVLEGVGGVGWGKRSKKLATL